MKAFFALFSMLSVPLGAIMRWCYELIPNYGIALILFAITTKVLMLPFAIKQQKNMINNTINQRKLKPKLDKLKAKYGRNKEIYNSELMKLYQEEGINPMGSVGAGCLLPLIQIVIMFGLIGVIYAPAQHILNIPNETIQAGIKIANDLQSTATARYQELSFISTLKHNPGAFMSLGKDVVNSILNFKTTLLGIDFVLAPRVGLNPMMILPILTIVTQLFSIFQANKYHISISDDPAQEKMMKITQFGPVVAFSFIYFAMPSGIAFYFMFSNILSLLQTEMLHKKFNTIKLIAQLDQQEREEKLRQKEEKVLLKKQVEDGQKLSNDNLKLALSKKEYNKQKINEARKKLEEKYGENQDQE